MSIRPNTIDRRGEKPCIENFWLVAKRLAEGRTPSLRQRISRALANLRGRLAQ